ncbi:MAG: SRPBCC family protein [Panacagrimonas sp.]
MRFAYPPYKAALLVAAALTGAGGTASAFELHEITVVHAGERYRIEMSVSLDVPARDAFGVFSDVSKLPQINPSVREARVLRENISAGLRVYTNVRMCISFFCRHLEQVQDMQFLPDGTGGEIRADVLPERSDLRYGRAHWTLKDCAGRTCLKFDAELEPDFWVPPLIGPWLIQRKLRSEAMETSDGIERLARAKASRFPVRGERVEP